MKKRKNVLQMKSIYKSFGNFFANKDVSLNVKQNSIHGLLGENGAGKTTLMQILFGLLKPDKGSILINNEKVNVKNPIYAQKLGIGMVHQHFKFIGIFDSVDNITLGSEKRNKLGFVERKKAKEKIEKLSKKYNFNIDLKKPVESLSVSQQQKVEILKILYKDPSILIFDEPTAILSPIEIESFLDLLRELKKNGKTIILISHKLDEIKEVCESATILRKGEFIKEINVKKTSVKEMSTLMIGKKIVEEKNTLKIKPGNTILEINNISSENLQNVSFSVKRGEIVAIAGIEGNGQEELVKIIMGLNRKFQGEIYFSKKGNDKTSLKNKNIKELINMGISYVPEDRQKDGIILNLDVSKNTVLSQYNKVPFSKHGFLNFKKINDNCNKIAKHFNVRGIQNSSTLAKNLSGGNQQKLILGREINKDHELLVVYQPTRGLDVGSINNTHKFLLKERKTKGVLLFSFELEEILDLADRIIVFYNGEIAGELNRAIFNKEIIGQLMLRGKSNA